jgi:hypothetical protein
MILRVSESLCLVTGITAADPPLVRPRSSLELRQRLISRVRVVAIRHARLCNFRNDRPGNRLKSNGNDQKLNAPNIR